MDVRDMVLQQTMPTVMVPLFGKFEPLATAGNRILAAKSGFWVEARRPGIYIRQPIALQKAVALPYGDVTATLETQFSHLGHVLQEFVETARKALPNEVALALIWDDESKQLQTHTLKPISSSSGHIHYDRPVLQSGQHVVMDIHSHGRSDAYFSRTDNKDDAGDIKIAVVVGNVDQPTPTVEARLCTLGLYQSLSLSFTESAGRTQHGESNACAYHLD